jgi:hypothetical protein
MNVIMLDGHTYGDAEAVARRLEREQLITRSSYEVGPNKNYQLCRYCDCEQGDACLSWHWYRWDSPEDGTADSCIRWECCRAVLSEAEQDADPENICVEFPIVVFPARPALAA